MAVLKSHRGMYDATSASWEAYTSSSSAEARLRISSIVCQYSSMGSNLYSSIRVAVMNAWMGTMGAKGVSTISTSSSPS